MRLAAIASVCLTLVCAATMMRAAERDSENSGDLDVSPATVLHLPALFQAPTLHVLQADFAYTAPSAPSAGRFEQWTSRLRMRSYLPLSPYNALSVSHPAFGQMGELPLYAGGMLRRLPQAPENSSMQIRSIARSLYGRINLDAGLRALDRAHGLVATAGFSTRFGRFSVERGESQGYGSITSMRPVTIARFELNLR
ncbi:hypothetical protein [Terriglobus tenax]|uniref:hypothetical protein n=1 Tax=Terriglobus tenax TaxID=1111115 RepID=UPI0021E05C71|nr:hypothetical protein [Terriglobus tenax]